MKELNKKDYLNSVHTLSSWARLLVIEFGGNSSHSLYGIAQLSRGVYPLAHFLIEIIKSSTHYIKIIYRINTYFSELI